MFTFVIGLIIGSILTILELTIFKDFLIQIYEPIGILLNNLATGALLIAFFTAKKKHIESDWINGLSGAAIGISIWTGILDGLPIEPP